VFFVVFISLFALLFLLLSGYFTRFLSWFLVFVFAIGLVYSPCQVLYE